MMMMTTSSFDHESLSALRKANELLKVNKLNWQDVLFRKPIVAIRQNSNTHAKRENSAPHQIIIKEMEAADFNVSPWEFEFLGSIKFRYTLTEKQETCFNKIKDRYEKFCKDNQK